MKKKEIAIRCENLCKSFKDIVAVDNLNLEIEQGTLFALLGPNGAGKTTAIKMLCCLLPPTSGDAFVLNNSILKNELEIKKSIAVSPQESAFARNLTALENLEMIAAICGKTKEDARQTAEKFNLLSHPKQKAKSLSGGNQRKLSIAMALLSHPKILFLDEPTLGLDIEARSELWDTIKLLKKTTTIILTTHYLEEADTLADQIGIIVNGKLVENSTSKLLKEKYAKGKKKITLNEIYLDIVRGKHEI